LKYRIGDIATIVNGALTGVPDMVIEHLLIDSRKIVFPSSSLFFALTTPLRDGHLFIGSAYAKGVKCFMVSKQINSTDYPEASFIRVADTRAALQQLATYHRRQFSIPVIGITGSNGKTIVKEWLYQLLHADYNIVRSPKSYNSQVGVPLSIWQMNGQHQLALFEAGISLPGEMEKLEPIIQPDVGVCTNIGEAHSEGFENKNEKLQEKLKLFSSCDIIITNIDREEIRTALTGRKLLTWGKNENSHVQIRETQQGLSETKIILSINHSAVAVSSLTVTLPFTDDASVENALTCICVMLYLKMHPEIIQKRIQLLQPVNMRMEMKRGINNCILINDSYSADTSSLSIALNFLQQQSGKGNKTVILSDFLQSGTADKELYNQIARLLLHHEVNRVIGIGERISRHLAILLDGSSVKQDYYLRTESFLQQFRSSLFKEEAILIKGARIFEFEQIARLLSEKVHETRLEINLDALAHNLKEHRKILKPDVKIMAMVKAFAYGSGGAEIAGVLQYQGADYLGVAYADEGVELRKAGIRLPVMVMNPDENSFDVLADNNLEPEIFSFRLLKKFDEYLQGEALQQYPIHLEVETGMNRLGFSPDEIDELGVYLSHTNSFRVQSVFSHLAASDNAEHDPYTQQQNEKFIAAVLKLEKKLGYTFLKHIANSAAILRHPQLHYDMVRPGIGLYGVDSSGTKKLNFHPAAALKATIAQIKKIKAGESVSYNRNGKVGRESVIATVRIGYADGYPRRLGNGIGKMIVNGKPAPVIGTVCMDMVMLDITGIDNVREGDEAVVFGSELPVEQLAAWAQTIPYEIMTGISQRVKRVYFQE
jgi:alanine racemase